MNKNQIFAFSMILFCITFVCLYMPVHIDTFSRDKLSNPDQMKYSFLGLAYLFGFMGALSLKKALFSSQTNSG